MSRLIPTAMVVLLASAAPSLAFAQQCDFQGYLGNLGFSEASGNIGAINSDTGFMGLYQMGAESLVDAGLATGGTNWDVDWIDGMSQEQFLSDLDLQTQAYEAWSSKNWGYMQKGGATSLVGSHVLPNGEVLSASGLLQAGQFGWTRVQKFYENGGVCNKDTSDGNGVCVEEFMMAGNGFDVSNITGQPSDVDGQSCTVSPQPSETPWTGDTTSRTCEPTVSMLQNISCADYPAHLQGFCQRYKPWLMDMGECRAAENWARNAPPSGPHLESCKEQTFGHGTSSWSYVHGCAKAEPAMGEEGADAQDQRIIGAADDPACYERLRGLGIEFSALGKVDISTGGRTCIIPNGVQYSGGAVPLDRSVTLNCALVEQIEKFGAIARGMGVEQFGVLSTLSCRGINNTSGLNQAKTSLHGTGNAIDINKVVRNGQVVSTSQYFTDPSAREWLGRLRDLSCTVFDGTLAFRFYAGDWTHMHFQATETTSCDPYP